MKKKIIAGEEEVVPDKINELQKILDGTVASVRRIATDLRPSLLDDIGLIAAMEWEAEIINEHENELIAWPSVHGADLKNAGSVRYDTINHEMTRVKV